MTTYKLLQKNIGKTFPFEVDGVRWSAYIFYLRENKLGLSLMTKRWQGIKSFNVYYYCNYNTSGKLNKSKKFIINQALKAIEEGSHGKG